LAGTIGEEMAPEPATSRQLASRSSNARMRLM
jgi:hypothetical protein